MIEALVYLLGILAAELLVTFEFQLAGVISYIVILSVVLFRAAIIKSNRYQQLLLPLVLIPLFRIVSLALPIGEIPKIMWYHLGYGPLALSAIVVMNLLGFSWRQIGVSLKYIWIQIIVALVGVGLGLVQYILVRPESIFGEFSWQQIWMPTLMLMFVAGVAEEFVFRGVIQTGTTPIFGGWGILYVSALYTIVNLGFAPLINLPLIFLSGVIYGCIAWKTNSILGVAVSRGLLHTVFYLVAPLFF